MQKINIEAVLEKNLWTILGGIGGILLLLTVFFFWRDYNKKQEKLADSLLYQTQTKARQNVADKKIDEAVATYGELFTKFPSSRASYEASLQIGDIYMDSTRYDDAIKSYEKAITQAKDSFSSILANYSLGIAFETSGKFDQAINTYEKIVKEKKFDFLQPEILMALARCHEKLNQKELAIALYKEIQEKFSTRTFYSGAASVYEKSLAQGTN